MLPYAYWGKSIVYRAQADMKFSVSNAVLAVEGAVLDQEKFKDMEPLARHAALVLDEARKQNVDTRTARTTVETELKGLKPLPAWVSEIVSLLAR